MVKTINQIMNTIDEPKSEFSAAELQELKHCETTIRTGIKHFLSVGEALLTIREKQLYRAKIKKGKGNAVEVYETFTDYCFKEWRITRQYANRLIAAFQTETVVSAAVGEPVFDSVNSATEFRRLGNDAQEKCVQDIKSGVDPKTALNNAKQEPSDHLKAKGYVVKLSEICRSTSNEDLIAKELEPLVLWYQEYMQRQEKRQAALNDEFDMGTGTQEQKVESSLTE